MLSLLVASPLIERRSSLPQTSCAMQLVMCTIMKSARVLLLDSNHSAAHVQVAQTIKQGALVSSIVLCRPGASRRTSWVWRVSSTHPILFNRKNGGHVDEVDICYSELSVGYTFNYLSIVSIDRASSQCRII